MTRIITVTSQKGGVAKTTTATAIAHGLALRNLDVLLLDFDPQGHAAVALGLDQEPGLFEWLIMEKPFNNVMRSTRRDGLTLLPGNGWTKRVETILRAEWTIDQLVTNVNKVIHGWDCVVIDTAANGILSELAMRLSDVLIVPTVAETLGLQGVRDTIDTMRQIGHAEQVIVLPTLFDGRLNEHKTNLELLQRNFPRKTADPIPARAAVRECPAYGKTIWEHGNGSMVDVREAYTALLGRICGGAK